MLFCTISFGECQNFNFLSGDDPVGFKRRHDPRITPPNASYFSPAAMAGISFLDKNKSRKIVVVVVTMIASILE